MPEQQRLARLRQAAHALELGEAWVEVEVITNALLNQPGFREFLNTVPAGISMFLIADEVHNLGAPDFAHNPPESFAFRLGLSATPIRQYDEEGTDALLRYFGDVNYSFDLGQAIRAGCLTRYHYYLHPADLNGDEFDEWEEISSKLAKMGFGAVEDDTPGLAFDEIKKLLFRRRSILENAESKVACLRSLLLAQRPAAVKHTLKPPDPVAPRIQDIAHMQGSRIQGKAWMLIIGAWGLAVGVLAVVTIWRVHWQTQQQMIVGEPPFFWPIIGLIGPLAAMVVIWESYLLAKMHLATMAAVFCAFASTLMHLLAFGVGVCRGWDHSAFCSGWHRMTLLALVPISRR